MARDPRAEHAHPTSNPGLTRVQFQSPLLCNLTSPMTPVASERTTTTVSGPATRGFDLGSSSVCDRAMARWLGSGKRKGGTPSHPTARAPPPIAPLMHLVKRTLRSARTK